MNHFKLLKLDRKYFMRFGVIIGASLMLLQLYRSINALEFDVTRLAYPSFLLLALVFLGYSIFNQMIAWKLLMNSIGLELPIKIVLQDYMLSFLPRYIPGTVWGYFSRAEWLFQEFQIAYQNTNTGSMLEVVVSLTTNLLMVMIFLLAKVDMIHQVILFICILMLPIVIGFLLRSLGRFCILNNVFSKGVNIELLKQLNITLWYKSVALITLSWFIYGAASMMIAYGLGISQNSFSLQGWLSYSTIFSLAWLAGFLVVFIPSGLGLREVVLANLLVSTFGFSINQASILSLLIRLTTTLAEIIWISVGMCMRSMNKSGTKL
jgi:glycosyltransferase 2 family protein